jgi:hypothetical protein
MDNLDNNINYDICNQNKGRNYIEIDTNNYSIYNFFVIENVYRIFGIIGLITVIINIPLLFYSNKINYTLLKLLLLALFLIFTIFGLVGFIGILIGATKSYNLTDEIYIYNNPKLQSNCNITYQFNKIGSDTYVSSIGEQTIGLIKLTIGILCLILLVQFFIFIKQFIYFRNS